MQFYNSFVVTLSNQIIFYHFVFVQNKTTVSLQLRLRDGKCVIFMMTPSSKTILKKSFGLFFCFVFTFLRSLGVGQN